MLCNKAILAQKLDDATEKGMEEGIEKGKIAGKTEVAKALLAEGMDVTTIAKVTRLSISKIEKLT